MKIAGWRIRDHLRLLLPAFALILLVWLIRYFLGTVDAPDWILHLFSVTGASAGAIVLAAFLIHLRRFGSYANVVAASLLLNAFAQILIAVAIALAVVTRTENIYTAPEFSMPGDDLLHTRHIYGHLTFGIAIGTLAGAAVGSLLLWLLRKILPLPGQKPD